MWGHFFSAPEACASCAANESVEEACTCAAAGDVYSFGAMAFYILEHCEPRDVYDHNNSDDQDQKAKGALQSLLTTGRMRMRVPSALSAYKKCTCS